MAKQNPKQIRVTLVKSAHGRKNGHRETVLGLGLRKTNDARTLTDTPAVRGMINKVSYLVKTEEV